MTFVQTTDWETLQIQHRWANGEILPPVIHRYYVVEEEAAVWVYEETNDNNDDGVPDGQWDSWSNRYTRLQVALKYVGKCRVGATGVIVTVMLNGKELR